MIEEKLTLVTHGSQVKVGMLLELHCLCGSRHRFIVTSRMRFAGRSKDARGNVAPFVEGPAFGMAPGAHGVSIVVFDQPGLRNLFIVETGLKNEATPYLAAPKPTTAEEMLAAGIARLWRS